MKIIIPITRLFLLSLLFLSQSKIISAQTTKDTSTVQKPVAYSSLNLIYIDNSKFTPQDGLTPEMVEKIKIVNDSITNEPKNKYLIMVSNGHSAKPTVKYMKSDQILETIYSGASEVPNKSEDYEKMDQALFNQPFNVTGPATLHYFATDQFYKSLIGQPKEIISGLAQKIKLVGNVTGETLVNLYYSNRSGSLDENSMIAEYDFYNQPRIKSGITIKFIKL